MNTNLRPNPDTASRRIFVKRVLAGTAAAAAATVPSFAAPRTAPESQPITTTTPEPFGPAARTAFEQLDIPGQVLVLNCLASIMRGLRVEVDTLLHTPAQRAWWGRQQFLRQERDRITQEYEEQAEALQARITECQREVDTAYDTHDRRRLYRARRAEKPVYAELRALDQQRDAALAALGEWA